MESNIVESSTCISLAFLLFLLLDISLNLDCGVIPVYLYEISDQFKLSRWNQGVLGSLSPAGFSVSTILFSYLLRRYSPKAILISICVYHSKLGVCLCYQLDTIVFRSFPFWSLFSSLFHIHASMDG
jgi:hypothetical protein